MRVRENAFCKKIVDIQHIIGSLNIIMGYILRQHFLWKLYFVHFLSRFMYWIHKHAVELRSLEKCWLLLLTRNFHISIAYNDFFFQIRNSVSCDISFFRRFFPDYTQFLFYQLRDILKNHNLCYKQNDENWNGPPKFNKKFDCLSISIVGRYLAKTHKIKYNENEITSDKGKNRMKIRKTDSDKNKNNEINEKFFLRLFHFNHLNLDFCW